MAETGSAHVPVTYESCEHVRGPFYHGTNAALEVGDELVPGYGSNFHAGRMSNNIYIVEPLGPFEDDPNVTNQKYPGNPTQSYRSRHPLRIVAELNNWQGHEPEVLKDMLDRLAQLREHGLDVIED